MGDLPELAEKFQSQYLEISKAFSGYQQENNILCPIECGKCCFKEDISCTPYEFLPLAFYLLSSDQAEGVLQKALEDKNKKVTTCSLLFIISESEGHGRCSQYLHRPFICRAFGVSARHGKKMVEYSVCPLLKDQFSKVQDKSTVPFIDEWRRQFENLDPHLFGPELPINEALIFALEKVLLWNSYQLRA